MLLLTFLVQSALCTQPYRRSWLACLAWKHVGLPSLPGLPEGFALKTFPLAIFLLGFSSSSLVVCIGMLPHVDAHDKCHLAAGSGMQQPTTAALAAAVGP